MADKKTKREELHYGEEASKKLQFLQNKKEDNFGRIYVAVIVAKERDAAAGCLMLLHTGYLSPFLIMDADFRASQMKPVKSYCTVHHGKITLGSSSLF